MILRPGRRIEVYQNWTGSHNAQMNPIPFCVCLYVVIRTPVYLETVFDLILGVMAHIVICRCT